MIPVLMTARPYCPTTLSRWRTGLTPERHVYVFSWLDDTDIPLFERTVGDERTALARLATIANQSGRSGFYFVDHIPKGFRFFR